MSDAPTGFTHITVTPSPEEEVVYHVGPSSSSKPTAVPAAWESTEEVGAAEPRPSFGQEDAAGPAEAGTATRCAALEEDAAAGAAEPSVAAEPAEVPAGNAEAPAGNAEVPTDEPKEKRRRTREYHETTLDDLERQPMSLTQKIVLICAFVLLVGFVLYYTILM